VNSSPSPRRREGVTTIVVVFVLSRLLVLALYAPVLEAGDQSQYVRVAQSIVDHGFGSYLDPGFVVEKGPQYPYFHGHKSLPDGSYNPIFWDPLYPFFLAVVLDASGGKLGAVRAVQLLLSLLTLLIGMDTVRRMFPAEPAAPRVFGWLLVATLPFAGFVTKILGETLDAFLLTCLLWMVSRLAGQRALACLGFGLLLGLYVSIKSYWLQLLPLVLLFVWWLVARCSEKPVPLGGRVGRLALVLAGVIVVLLPTGLRNDRIGAGALLISTKGSWNLWKDNNHFRIENHGWRVEGLAIRSWLDAYYPERNLGAVPASLEGVYDDPAHTTVRPPCDTELAGLAACERGRALGFFFEDPLRFARRALEKNANLWSPNSYVFNRAPPGRWAWNQNFRVELPGPVRYGLQLWVALLYLLSMLAFFVGVGLPARSSAHRGVRAFTILSLLCLVLVVVPWGHGVTRFRLPFMVPILMFASVGLLCWRCARTEWEAAPGGARPRLVAIGGLALLLLGLAVTRLATLLAP